jgi:GT2 family glycosyltransferase
VGSLGRNYGFAKANNFAANLARGEIVAFVNNDMRFTSNFVARLVGPILDDGRIFATDAAQLDLGRELTHSFGDEARPAERNPRPQTTLPPAHAPRQALLWPAEALLKLGVETVDFLSPLTGRTGTPRARSEEMPLGIMNDASNVGAPL